jgi:hypothetical protein
MIALEMSRRGPQPQWIDTNCDGIFRIMPGSDSAFLGQAIYSCG